MFRLQKTRLLCPFMCDCVRVCEMEWKRRTWRLLRSMKNGWKGIVELRKLKVHYSVTYMYIHRTAACAYWEVTLRQVACAWFRRGHRPRDSELHLRFDALGNFRRFSCIFFTDTFCPVSFFFGKFKFSWRFVGLKIFIKFYERRFAAIISVYLVIGDFTW